MQTELSKNFEPLQVDQKWYDACMEKGYFNSRPNSLEPYTIVMPPPNVTGVLHMGHCLNNTIQDILTRRARMNGKNACWVPGTDHASIATEAKVVALLREKGIDKSSLTRDEFLSHAWDWKEKFGGIILQQLKKLGCSLDWDRTTFTMDPDYYQSVIGVFNDLHEKGYIYRGKRMINWDVKALTALSDEEVIRKEVHQKLYYLKYFIIDKPGDLIRENHFITVATVRPETIMGDAAVCVHPGDERYKKFHGKYAVIPIINKTIPIITDEYVTMDFGTGALKITPAHDLNDNQLGMKHNLEVVDIFNDDGTLNDEAQIFIGLDRFEARKQIVRVLEAEKFLTKTEDYTSEVGYSERTDVVVEPRLSLQWWVSMKELARPALDSVMTGDINFYPPKFKNLYKHWMEGGKDWCISRQLWWGHRIPAWYDEAGNVYVARTEQEAKMKAMEKDPSLEGKAFILKQDEDCLDTWFSSWLWPFEVFKGYSNPGNEDVKYYYPTNTLVTAPEIIFFWVARMIIAGHEWMHEIPFKDVYFTGIVRDNLGRKMSKSLGNSPDLLALIDQYGADAVRFGIMIASPAGNDLLFEESSLEQGRNFNNKMWNALKLIRMWDGRADQNLLEEDSLATDWLRSRINTAKAEVHQLMDQFRLSEALKVLYSLVWDDFCSWYLEWVKPGFEQPISAVVLEKTKAIYSELLQMLNPFMPFITEEINAELGGEVLCVKQFTMMGNIDENILQKTELLKETISAIRDLRNKNQVKPREKIELFIQTEDRPAFELIKALLAKQVNAGEIKFVAEPVSNSLTLVAGKNKFYIKTEGPLATGNQKEELEKELTYLHDFLAAVEKKLGNERFVQNAKPEVVALEQKKKADALTKIKVIEESLTAL